MVFVLLHPHSVVVGDFLPGVVLVGPQLTLIILVEKVVLILLSSIQPVPGIVNLQLHRNILMIKFPEISHIIFE